MDYTIEAVLAQLDKKRKLHPVVFLSRKLILAEQNYNIYNKEILAIVAVFKK